MTFSLLLWQSLYRVSNSALNVLLKFLSAFIPAFGSVFTSDSLRQLSSELPHTTTAAYKLLWKVNKDDFVEFVVCSSCHSLYSYEDCYITRHGQKESKACTHVAYPNHPVMSKRKQCGSKLLKKVKSGRSYRLVPIKVYPYQSLHKSLSYLVQKDGFLDACEKWRKRVPLIPDAHLADIYDGHVWSDFQANDFLNAPFCYLLTLNVDWFQPFSHIQYSVGAIYLTVQNLPRCQRYKEENLILVGILPGPSEPPLTINSYLSPLVGDLKQAWDNGITLTTRDGSAITVRLALSCVACDIPASRKVCGFLGHNAELGCNKCYKQFVSRSLGHIDYSGYDRENWAPRTVTSHRQKCRELMKEVTKTGMCKSESNFGV